VTKGLRDERGRDVPGARLPPERRALERTEKGRQRRPQRPPRAARAVDLPGWALSEMPALRPLCLRHRLIRCLRLEVPASMRWLLLSVRVADSALVCCHYLLSRCLPLRRHGLAGYARACARFGGGEGGGKHACHYLFDECTATSTWSSRPRSSSSQGGEGGNATSPCGSHYSW